MIHTMMNRLVLALPLLSSAAFCGSLFSLGVKGGVPFNDAVKTVTTANLRYVDDSKNYTIGPTLDIHLPFGLGVEADLLYRRIGYTTTGSALQKTTKGNAWDVPLLLKWKMAPGPIQPYLVAGPTFRGLSNLKERLVAFTTSETDHPTELKNKFNTGITLGGGLLLLRHVSGELRYTRWGLTNFKDVTGIFKSNPDQFEALVGITF